ncbi:universal stress protein [Pseudonocardia saturnea]
MARGDGHIVIGLDDSEGGRAALRFALHDAVRRGARLDVVAAFRIPGTRNAFEARPPAEPSIAEITGAVRALVSGMVEEVVAELDPSVVPPPVSVLAVGGSAGEVLVHTARNADLLVVGSRGHGRVAGAVLGSVSLHCMLHATCPVTVVQPGTVPAEVSAPVPG